MKLYDVKGAEQRAPATGGTIEDRSIGRILVDMGKLTPHDLSKVFALHRKRGMRFGEAARQLKLVDDADIQYALAVQFNYPYLKPGQGMLGQELIAAHDPYDAQSEAFRELRTQLVMQWADAAGKVLAIASLADQDGKSYLAANLAVAFAQLGQKTLLIDADLRAPRQHRIFGLAPGAGLAQMLGGRGRIAAVARIPYFESLGVLPAGTAPPNPLELLSRPLFANLLTEARKVYAVVLIDTPAVARGADARVIATRADGAIILARQHRTSLADLERLARTVTSSGVPVVGTVLNQM